MDLDTLKNQFTGWIETKTNRPFDIMHPFSLVCLESVLMEFLHSTYNGVPFYRYYSPKEQFVMLLEQWKTRVELMISLALPINSLTFGSVPVPIGADADYLRDELQTLSAQCLA